MFQIKGPILAAMDLDNGCGPAAPAILSAVEELPAQLLVMGTHGRTGLSRIFALGSVAEAVVRAAPCSVLIVRLV